MRRPDSNPYWGTVSAEDAFEEGYDEGWRDRESKGACGALDSDRYPVREALIAALRVMPDCPERWDIEDALRLIPITRAGAAS